MLLIWYRILIVGHSSATTNNKTEKIMKNHLSNLNVRETQAGQFFKWGILPQTWDSVARNKHYIEALRERDNHQCVYCGCKVNKHNATTDHVLPQVDNNYQDGRQHSESNVVTACLRCNTSKGSKSVYDFMVFNGYEMKDIIRVQNYIADIVTGKRLITVVPYSKKRK